MLSAVKRAFDSKAIAECKDTLVLMHRVLSLPIRSQSSVALSLVVQILEHVLSEYDSLESSILCCVVIADISSCTWIRDYMQILSHCDSLLECDRGAGIGSILAGEGCVCKTASYGGG